MSSRFFICNHKINIGKTNAFYLLDIQQRLLFVYDDRSFVDGRFYDTHLLNTLVKRFELTHEQIIYST